MTRIIKAFKASGAIAHRRYVEFTATSGVVSQANAATDKLAGIVDQPGGAADGETVDVVLLGLTEIEAGGTFAAGDYLVSDANGKAIVAAPATGVNNTYGSRAMYPAVSGDRVQVYVNPGSLQG